MYASEPCLWCGKTDQMVFYSYGRFFCKRCKRYFADVFPVGKLEFYRKEDARHWGQGKAFAYTCVWCKKFFRKYYEHKNGYFNCPWCVKERYLSDLSINKIAENGLFLDTSCPCGKKVRVNLFLMFVRSKFYNYEVCFKRRSPADLLVLEDDLSLVEFKGFKKKYLEDPEILEELNELRKTFVIACSRKCVGSYKNLIMKRICKNIWIVEKVKTRCVECKQVNLFDIREKFEGFCPKCHDKNKENWLISKHEWDLECLLKYWV